MRKLLALFAVALIYFLRSTWRVRITGSLPDRTSGPFVFCFWHGNQAGLLAYRHTRPVSALVSLSRDGDLQSHILTRLGFRVVRGSSSRKAAAGLVELLRFARLEHDVAFAVDGPRGPRFKAKPGAAYVARQTNGTLIPITAVASSAWVFKRAWDQYQLPKFFARLEIKIGAAIRAQSNDIDSLCLELEKSLIALDHDSSAQKI